MWADTEISVTPTSAQVEQGGQSGKWPERVFCYKSDFGLRSQCCLFWARTDGTDELTCMAMFHRAQMVLSDRADRL